MSRGALIHVEENAMDASWKDVLLDNSDMDDILVSDTLVSFIMASFRLLSLAPTTVWGVLAVSVPLLDVLPRFLRLSSSEMISCFSALSSVSPLPEWFEVSPTVNRRIQANMYWCVCNLINIRIKFELMKGKRSNQNPRLSTIYMGKPVGSWLNGGKKFSTSEFNSGIVLTICKNKCLLPRKDGKACWEVLG